MNDYSSACPEFESDDYVIDSSRSGYSVSNLGVFAEWDQVIPAIIEDMKGSQFFPNVWEVNDHGNVDLLSVNTETGEYSIVQS